MITKQNLLLSIRNLVKKNNGIFTFKPGTNVKLYLGWKGKDYHVQTSLRDVHVSGKFDTLMLRSKDGVRGFEQDEVMSRDFELGELIQIHDIIKKQSTK